MTEATEIPIEVKSFNAYGSNLHPPIGGSGNWEGDCIFCGKEKHFYVNVEKGMFDCKVCGAEGNLISFLTRTIAELHKETPRKFWQKIADSRGIPSKVIKRRKLAYDGEYWLIPCFSETGTVRDIRRYNFKTMMATPGCKTQLFGMDRLAKAKTADTVWLCEGEWDAIAMDWLQDSLGKKDVVVAVPGAGIFKETWISKFKGKNVICVYDMDSAGEKGAEKAFKKLKPVALSVKFVNWPDATEPGYDLRDFITVGMQEEEPAEVMKTLMDLTNSHPKTLLGEKIDEKTGEIEEELEPADLAEVFEVYNKHVLMNDDMDDALKVMLATCLSNDLNSDPLWIHIVGPPGTGKTLLLSGFQSSKRCVFRSNVTPASLVSGWKGSGENDPSLIPKLAGKTFVVKDFTEVLTMPGPQQDEVYSTLRGAYDGSVQRSFGNAVMREYDNCFFSMMTGVTHAIHGNKKASLGERFLKFQINSYSEEHTNEVVSVAIRNVGQERQLERDLQGVISRFLTKSLDTANMPTLPSKFHNRLLALVQLIAVLRAQVTRDERSQDIMFRPVPEAGTRLAKQLVKLGYCLAALEDKKEVDDECYRLMERVAFDTAHGFHLDIIAAIMSLNGVATKQEISEATDLPSSSLYRKFDDLLLLKVLEKTGEKRVTKAGGRPSVVYKLKPNIAELWRKAKGEEACQKKTTTKKKSKKPTKPKVKKSTTSKRKLVRRRRNL